MPEPVRTEPPGDWEHYELFTRVKESLYALPFYFKTETVISGIQATDLFTLNAALGATIEEQVVQTLNSMRPIWDPDEQYRLYGFIRQSQTFPDVLLKKNTVDNNVAADIIMGIELKGWYLLAKEEEPSFRFLATPTACATQDLITVVPWVLSNVLSGSPIILNPWVESARYAAEYKNYYWQHCRETTLDTSIRHPEGITPYPRKSYQISDQAAYDKGKNFGRLARTGIIDAYVQLIAQQKLCGIEAKYWRTFFKIFQDQRPLEEIQANMERFIISLRREVSCSETVLQHIEIILNELTELVSIEK